MSRPSVSRASVVALVLSALVILAQVGCSVEIIHDLQESQANEILAALNSQGVSGEKLRVAQGSKASYTVSVGRGDAVTAWRVLREQNLPRPKLNGLGEVFGKTGLIPTATQERALMHHALAGELSKTLRSVDGVLEARVHVVLPTRDPLAPTDQPLPGPKASVLLHVGAEPPLQTAQVQQLVAGAIKGLKPAAVSVIMVKAQTGEKKRARGAAAVLARVGPFSVAAGSRNALLATLIAGVMVIGVLALAVLLVLRRNRRIATEIAAADTRGEGSLSMARLDSSLGLLSRSVTRGRSRATGAGKDSY
jgi:type III secretion protein J